MVHQKTLTESVFDSFWFLFRDFTVSDIFKKKKKSKKKIRLRTRFPVTAIPPNKFECFQPLCQVNIFHLTSKVLFTRLMLLVFEVNK